MRQIIAMGGGGFSMEPDNLLLDQYILSQAHTDVPKICFIPTASGKIKEGYAVDDGVALHFKDEKLFASLSSRPTAKAYAVNRKEEEVTERELPVTYLGNRKE
ncbi:Type 1 glutamine amidotransferase-like domain-containing protein [Priestia megaterium]